MSFSIEKGIYLYKAEMPGNLNPKKADKTIVNSKLWRPVAYMFFMLLILVWLNEVLDLPHRLLGTVQTPINWAQAILESIFISIVAFITVLMLIHNIEKRKKAEDQIRNSLKEKETLLQEIHHRVKNNLQIISSLLRLQARRVKEDNVKRVYQESNNRITAMALVHEILYRSETLAEIELKEYITYLSKNLFKVYRDHNKDVAIIVDVNEIILGINQALSTGLILNELISNALKHAFKDRQQGKIEIRCTISEDGEIEILLNDNGIGIEDGIEHMETKTLGLQLVKGLVEKQLNGTLSMTRDSGTRFTIRFKREDTSGGEKNDEEKYHDR